MPKHDMELLYRGPSDSAGSQRGGARRNHNAGLFISWFAILLPFAWLWFRLIDYLRVEWSSNPQYAYGWVVPFLCVGLIGKRWTALRTAFRQGLDGQKPISANSRMVVLSVFVLLALLYLPIRMIEGANPAWRITQWLLGLATVGLTLCLIYLAGGRLFLKTCLFPTCLILIAIPWPTLIEAPLIQSLTRLNTRVVIELLSWFRIPALQHGNLIELNTGTVGIDEACSGIRSFQSCLMISLFFGELYGMSIVRRLLFIPVGFSLAMLLNLCRMSLLTLIAARKGVAAIGHYHDPAGISIALISTIGLWGLALLFNPRPGPVPDDSSLTGSPIQDFKRISPCAPILRMVGWALLLWLVVVEVGVGLWYRIAESNPAPSLQWTVTFPTNNSTLESLPIDAATENLLRFDEGKQARWAESDGSLWQAFYFSWRPGRVAGYLAKRHTPEICLPASGAKLLSGPKLTIMNVKQLALPMRSYVFGTESGPLYVFQCRWEAGAGKRAYVEEESSRFNLLRGIWAGRGNQGQKVLEIVVAKMSGPEQAAAAMSRKLEELVTVKVH